VGVQGIGEQHGLFKVAAKSYEYELAIAKLFEHAKHDAGTSAFLG